jgi:hypothetical protein
MFRQMPPELTGANLTPLLAREGLRRTLVLQCMFWVGGAAQGRPGRRPGQQAAGRPHAARQASRQAGKGALQPPAATMRRPPLFPSPASPQAMHALLFPSTLRWTALVQIAVCVCAVFATAGLACAVRAEPVLMAGAQLLCQDLQRAGDAAYTALGLLIDAPGAPADGARPALCKARPVELLVVFANTLSCLGTVRWRMEAQSLGRCCRRSRPVARALPTDPPACSAPCPTPSPLPSPSLAAPPPDRRPPQP